MLILMDGWEPGLLFTESHHQITTLFRELIPEVQPVLPIRVVGGMKLEETAMGTETLL